VIINRRAMHPGLAVRHDCVEKNGLSVTDAARLLGVDRQTLSNLLNARSGISAEMAVRLEKAFGTPARHWLIRQLDYDLAQVMRRATKLKVEQFRSPSLPSEAPHERR
jgi:addiction module HigA family antidote